LYLFHSVLTRAGISAPGAGNSGVARYSALWAGISAPHRNFRHQAGISAPLLRIIQLRYVISKNVSAPLVPFYVLSSYLIDLCVLIPVLFLPPSFTGGSSSRPKHDQRGRSTVRKRNFWFTDEGTLEDKYVVRQAEQEAEREAAKEKAARAAKRVARNPSRVPRVNYDTMNSIE
jgi:hypothetical protein